MAKQQIIVGGYIITSAITRKTQQGRLKIQTVIVVATPGGVPVQGELH